jgi:pescadillo protein
VGWERGGASSGSAFKANHDKITHHIIDRPPQGFERIEGREYVQPQWVFDSFNMGCLMPVNPYAPGRSPPPHLSPFVDDAAEGYVPRQREILDRVAAEAVGADIAPVANASVASDGAVATEGGAPAGGAQAFARYSEELKAEAGGVWHSEFAEKRQLGAGETKDADAAESVPAADVVMAATNDGPSSDEEAEEAAAAPKPTEEEEERLRRKALMPKKHKRLLQRIEYTEKKKTDRNAALRKKRAKTEKE